MNSIILLGNLFDISGKGTLIGCSIGDNITINEYDLYKRINTWNFEGDKLVLKAFKNNYLIVLSS